VTKIVYIAGPFRGLTAWDVACNVHRAEELAFAVAKAGAMPLCPHANTRDFDGTLTDKFWIDGTLELLRRCDAVIVVPGWEESTGTRGEIEEAKRIGLSVFYDQCELRAWLDMVGKK